MLRNVGTNTRRVSAIPGYSVPFSAARRHLGTARVELVAAAYDASHLNEQPNYSTDEQRRDRPRPALWRGLHALAVHPPGRRVAAAS